MLSFESTSLEETLETLTEELEVIHCLECDGTNLNEEETLCWDCASSDYE